MGTGALTQSAEGMTHPQVGFDIDRVILFEADMDRAQGARNDRWPAPGKAETGPLTPLREGAGDHHAAGCDLDDPGAEAKMGAHPGIVG